MMELSEALNAKQEIFSALGLTYVRTRAGEPRISVGVSVPDQSPNAFRVAIRARSQEELDRARAAGRLDPFAKYPESALDIQITGPIVAPPVGQPMPATKRLSIGASIGHYLCTAGSLGFFARRTVDGAIGMVSNNHVLAAEDEGEDGDDILHPAPADEGVRELNVVGYLAGDYPRLDEEAPTVDCAFATLREGIAYDPSTIGPGLRLKREPAVLELQRDVLKNGRSTGLTRGRITAFAIDHCDVELDFGIVVFDRQIEIASSADGPFSQPGDSGSLVVNPDGQPVGLLASGTFDCRLHYANPIDDVLRSLGLTVLT
jgi:hypothetical protein